MGSKDGGGMCSNRPQIVVGFLRQCRSAVFALLVWCAFVLGVGCPVAHPAENATGSSAQNPVTSGFTHPSPPFILEMDGFTLYVQSWQSYTLELNNRRAVNANGLAWVSFDCQPVIALPFPGKTLVERTFNIVQFVRNPAEEIAVADAKKLDAQATLGSSMVLRLPNDLQSAE